MGCLDPVVTFNNFSCPIGTLHQYFDEKWNFMALKLSEREEKSIGPSQPQWDKQKELV